MVAAMERDSRWRFAGECNWGAAMETDVAVQWQQMVEAAVEAANN